MTGRPLASIEIADFELRVKSLAPERWSLQLTTLRRADGARSTREIHGASCVEVTDAAAVAIALAIGPSPEHSKIEPKSGLNHDQPAPAELTGPPLAKPAPAPAHGSLEWLVGVAGALDSSATPSLALGASVHFGLSWLPTDKSQTRLRFELQGALYAPTETDSVNGQAGKFQLFYAAPLVCGVKPLGGTALLACAGYELGRLSGEGIGYAVTSPHPSNTFWSAARAELGLLVPLTRSLRFVGRAGVAIPLVRREFVLDSPEVVFRPAPLTARIALGIELSL